MFSFKIQQSRLPFIDVLLKTESSQKVLVNFGAWELHHLCLGIGHVVCFSPCLCCTVHMWPCGWHGNGHHQTLTSSLLWLSLSARLVAFVCPFPVSSVCHLQPGQFSVTEESHSHEEESWKLRGDKQNRGSSAGRVNVWQIHDNKNNAFQS